jgi:endoglucanase
MRWRSVGFATLAVIVLAATAALTVRATSAARACSPATRAATYFLARYDTTAGLVVQRDQGGDTVSEGQAYGLLLAVAAGDQAGFARTWQWTRAHLIQPDGLMAWRWRAGRVSDPQSAADADIDAAWALLLAADRFGDPSYRAAAGRMAGAVLRHEVVTGRNGGAVLVAGPWAAAPPLRIDPSYDAPVDFAALAAAFPSGGKWSEVAAGARRDIGELVGGGHLPSDWAVVGSDGVAHPTSAPAEDGGAVRYGFDAVRVPVRQAASCDKRDRALAAGMWGVLSGPVARHQPLVNLDLGGSAGSGAADSPVGLVGAAAAARAAGRADMAGRLLDRAQALNAGQPTYYGSAWVALGRVLLQTGLLGGCGARA